MEDLIHHISDTALWIAAYRARETDREDAVFRDLFAGKLAGERGKEMVAATPNTELMAFAMVVRTCAIDRLVEMAIAKGADMVINLGAGLDTRPYRLKLPSTLRWIEVDFPHLIAYKDERLAGEKSVCYLQRISADFSSDPERRNLFARLGAETRKALILTEGVVGYLTNDQAGQLSMDLHAIPAFHFWIQDYKQGRFRKNTQSRALKKILHRTPLKFNVADPIGFFGRHGWTVNENIFILDEADRIGRSLQLMFPWNLLMRLFPKRIRTMGNKTFGYVLLERN